MNGRTGPGLYLAWVVAFLIALMCFPAPSRAADDDFPDPSTLPGPPPVRTWIPPDTQEIGGPFNLIDQDGSNVTEKNYDKFYKLVFFGYTNCPAQCPMGLTKLVKALNRLGPRAENIRILFITTDPGRDTPAVMKKYIGRFATRQMVGLTGTKYEIEDAENKFRIYSEKVTNPDYPAYTVNHSTVIYFTAPDGKFLTVFNTADSPPIIALKIKQHL